MKHLHLIMLQSLLFFPFCGSGQPPIQWEFNYGGSAYESGNGIIENASHELIMCAVTHSTDNDVSGNHGNSDYWAVRLDSSGGLLNQKCMGGSGYDDGRSVIPVSGGGYVFLGAGGSGDGDQSGNWGNTYDYWIVKTDASFNIIWETNLGGNDFDVPYGVCETYDGGFVIVGTSMSSDGNVGGNYGNSDYWVAKVDSTGTLLWEKNYGGSGYEEARGVIEMSDHALVVCGFSGSSDGDIVNPKGNQDFWVLMLNSAGNLIWATNYGGAASDIAYALLENNNGDIMVVGETGSVNGEVSYNHGYTDYWLIEINPEGMLLWEKSYGGTDQEVPSSIIQTADSGYVIAGRSKSADGDVGGNQGGEDFWIIKTDQTGNLLWEKAIGGSLNDGAECVIETADTGYVISGYTESSDGDISGNNYGIADCWVVKLHDFSSQSDISELPPTGSYTLYPNPASQFINCEAAGSRLLLYNLTGTLVSIKDRKGKGFDLTGIAKGTYISELYHRHTKLLKRQKIIVY